MSSGSDVVGAAISAPVVSEVIALSTISERQDLLLVRALVPGAPAPLPPPRLRARERRVGVLDGRGLLIGEMPRQGQSLARALDRDELGPRGPVLDPQRQRRAEAKRIRSGGRGHAVRRRLDPRHDRPVVRAERQLHPHRNPPPHPSTIRIRCGGPSTSPRHEVDHADDTLRGLELGLQHERPGPIAARARRAPRRPVPAASARAARSPSRAAKHDPESNRGRHSQSTDPSRPTSAADCRSPMKP